MKPFDLDLLFLPGFLIFIVTWCVAFYVTRSVVFSLPAAFLKAGIFFIYFGLLFDGTFTFLDDWRYVAGGMALLNEGVGLSNLVENWEFVLMKGIRMATHLKALVLAMVCAAAAPVLAADDDWQK